MHARVCVCGYVRMFFVCVRNVVCRGWAYILPLTRPYPSFFSRQVAGVAEANMTLDVTTATLRDLLVAGLKAAGVSDDDTGVRCHPKHQREAQRISG